MYEDTIAAVATALSPSGIGIVRISGTEAFSLIDKIFKTNVTGSSTMQPEHDSKVLSQCESHTVHYGYIHNGEKVVDEVLVTVMKAPRTYTREDTVEINCHGGILVVRRVLETVLQAGARLAEPGEFTKRAFLNGRIDLSQAEAVMDLIASKNEYALDNSLRQVQGALLGAIREKRAVLLEQIAFLEAALDDPEHYSLEGYAVRLSGIVDKLCMDLEQMVATFENGRYLKEGINTVIVGKPNVGKSTFLNQFIGAEKAIVTDIAGTTRDVIEESVQFEGFTLNLVDTAGLRETSDPVEQLGVEKAREYLNRADLVLYIVDGSVPLDENDVQIMEQIQDKRAVVLLNKTDLDIVVEIEEITNKLKKDYIFVSAKENRGFDILKEKMKALFYNGDLQYNDEVCITNIRHKRMLQEAIRSLCLVREGIDNQMPEDFYTIDMTNAYENLGFIIGESLGEDVVREIFGKFCMGK